MENFHSVLQSDIKIIKIFLQSYSDIILDTTVTCLIIWMQDLINFDKQLSERIIAHTVRYLRLFKQIVFYLKLENGKCNFSKEQQHQLLFLTRNQLEDVNFPSELFMNFDLRIAFQDIEDFTEKEPILRSKNIGKLKCFSARVNSIGQPQMQAKVLCYLCTRYFFFI